MASSSDLILLTPTFKNGRKWTDGQIAIDVSDITCPIEDAGGPNTVHVRNTNNFQLAQTDNVNADAWIVTETLAQIASQQFNLAVVPITKKFSTGTKNPVTYSSPKNFCFYMPEVVGPCYADPASGKAVFYYREQGNPVPVQYYSSLTVAQLVATMPVVGGVTSVNADPGPAVVLTVINSGPGGPLQWVGPQLQIPLGTETLVSKTYAQMQTLALGTIVPGQFYLITDRCDEGIIVQGATTTTVTNEGTGLFLNADYGGTGDYSGVPGFTGQLGVWAATLVVAIGKVVIWDNQHYKNTTGANGVSNPSIDGVNWTLIAGRSRTHGYIPVADPILYNFPFDQVTTRTDVNDNTVTGPSLQGFPWGSLLVLNCDLRNCTIQLQNSNGTIAGLKAVNASIIATGFTGALSNANLPNGGQLILDGATGSFIDTTINGNSCVCDYTNSGGGFQDVKLFGSSIFSAQNATGNASVQGIIISDSGTIDVATIDGTIINMSVSKATVTARMGGGRTLQNVTIDVPITFTFDPMANINNKLIEEGYSNIAKSINIDHSGNSITIVYNNLVGVIGLGDVVTDLTSGATGTVTAIGVLGSNILVNVTSGLGIFFNNGDNLSFSGGATATVNAVPRLTVVVPYNTLAVGNFGIGDVVTDGGTGATGKVTFDDQVSLLGLENVDASAGGFDNGNAISDSNGTTALVNGQTTYLNVTLTNYPQAGIITIDDIDANITIGTVSGASTHFRTKFMAQNSTSFIGLVNQHFLDNSTGAGNVYIPSSYSRRWSNKSLEDFCDYTKLTTNEYFYLGQNY